jgi:hypothetical protein
VKFKSKGITIPVAVLNELEKIVDNYEVNSIILIGSYSRNEHIKCDSILKSDIEFYIITEDIIPKKKIKHSDISVIPKKKIRHLEKNLINYETKIVGKTIYGEDLLESFPTINMSNIEKAIIDEILVFRALEILKFWNTEFKNQIMEKNIPYLLTWVQIKNDILLPGYFTRYNHFINNIENPIYNDLNRMSKILRKWFKIRSYNLEIKKWEDLTEFYIRFYTNHKTSLFQEVSLINRIKQIKYIVQSNFTVRKKTEVLCYFVLGRDFRIEMIEEFIRVLTGKKEAYEVLELINYYYPFLRENNEI